jgi:uncharacterized protein
VRADGPIVNPATSVIDEPPLSPSAPPLIPPHAAPVSDSERIVVLDVIRGFAILGVLVMTIQSCAMPFSAYRNPTPYGNLQGVNWWIWLVSHVLADHKFITLFSMLFGAGVVLFSTRAEARLGTSRSLHYRRMIWLLLIGLAHAHLLWYGDILFTYAVCGMLIYPLRKQPPRRLLIIGLVAFTFGSALYAFFGWSMRFWPPEQIAVLQREVWQPSPQEIAWELEAYRAGWLEQMEHRVEEAAFIEGKFLLMYELWRSGGVMLIGMALYKWGVLTGKRSSAFYWRCVAVGFLVGLPMILYGVYRNLQVNWDIRYSFFQGTQWNNWASILVSLAYVGALTLAYRRGVFSWLIKRLAAVGRMAFTNYLLQTLLCTTIFYGHGLGLFGSVSRVGQMAFVLGIWAFQLVTSPIWLCHFRMGPFEWLWRSLTYGAWQPLRR